MGRGSPPTGTKGGTKELKYWGLHCKDPSDKEQSKEDFLEEGGKDMEARDGRQPGEGHVAG